MADLVAALQLSRSSLYDTFGDKRSLFLEALRLYSRRVVGRTAQTLSETPSPLAGIRKLFEELEASAGSETGALGCFMVNSVAELVPYDAEVAQIAAEYNSAMQQLLAEAIALLPERKEQPEMLAAFVFNALQGIRILIKAGATRVQVKSISAITLKSLR